MNFFKVVFFLVHNTATHIYIQTVKLHVFAIIINWCCLVFFIPLFMLTQANLLPLSFSNFISSIIIIIIISNNNHNNAITTLELENEMQYITAAFTITDMDVQRISSVFQSLRPTASSWQFVSLAMLFLVWIIPWMVICIQTFVCVVCFSHNTWPYAGSHRWLGWLGFFCPLLSRFLNLLLYLFADAKKNVDGGC